MSTSTGRIVNRSLWTAQVLVAVLFLFAGSMKFILPAATLQQGPIVFPIAFIRFIGTCEYLGAAGLMLPGLLRIRTMLTPFAAAGLTIIMAGAVTVSAIGMGIGAAVLPAIVGVVTAGIAYGRGRLLPIPDAAPRTLRAA